MKIFNEKLKLTCAVNNVTFHNITEEAKEFLEKSNVKNGLLVVSSPHTTCSVIFEELSYDSNYRGFEYLQQDLLDLMDELIPVNKFEGQYHHPGPEHIRVGIEDFAGKISPEPYTMLNTDAHIRSTMLGASETFIIKNGKLQIGEVGYIYFIDWDQNRKRTRDCNFLIIGE